MVGFSSIILSHTEAFLDLRRLNANKHASAAYAAYAQSRCLLLGCAFLAMRQQKFLILLPSSVSVIRCDLEVDVTLIKKP